MSVLSLTYRPIRFSEVVGQSHIKPILKAMVAQQDVPPALLFSGTRGTGKTSVARIFAAALNCENPENGDACGSCVQCTSVQKTNSTSVLEIDAASNGGVNEVRSILSLVQYAHDANWRVVLIDEAHSMSKEANNALLKVLEEPPSNVVFLLVTTEPEKILGTVRSRALPFEFRRIRLDDLIKRLGYITDTESIEASEHLLRDIGLAAQGGLRDAVMILDQVRRAGVTTSADFRDFWGIQNHALPLMWAALRGDHAEGYRIIAEHFGRTGEAAGMVSDLSRLVSELLVIKSEGRPTDHTEEALAERVEMAQAAPTEAFVRVIEVLWELRSRTRASDNDQHAQMDMAFALITNSLRALHIEVPQRRAEPERLSIGEIEAFLD